MARLKTAFENSRLGGLADTVSDTKQYIATAWTRSKMGDAVDSVATKLSTVIMQSACVRWLTREPEPAVIVVDLTETRTVGPVIDVLRPVLNTLASAYRSSVAKGAIATTEQQTRPLSALVTQSASWSLLTLLFTPPEPPERNE